MVASPRFSTDPFTVRLGVFYAAYFIFIGVELPFFPLFLEARGLDAQAIGLVVAAPMLVRIVATPFAAHQADRWRALKAALVIGSAVATVAMTAVGLAPTEATIFAAFVVAAFAFSPLLALTDAYALSGLAPRGRAYGPVRLWGSVAFIVGNILGGALLHVLAPGHLIWLIVAALAAATVAALALLPLDDANTEAPPVAMPSPKRLLTDPVFLAVAAACALIQGSHALYYSFSTMQWRAAGLDGALIGTLWGLGVVAEVVLFAFSGRLPPPLPPTALILIGGAGAVIRWTAMAFDPPVALLPVLQLLHAASFAATHLGLMGFLARTVPRQMLATAQGVVATAMGLVNGAGTFASGFAYAASGSRAYLLMAAMALAGVVSALYAGRRWHAS